MKKLFLLSLILFYCRIAFAQVNVQVKLTQPPPNQLRASDIWKVNIFNPSRAALDVIIYGTLEESSDGIIVNGNSRTLKIPPGNKIITYDDVKSGQVNFKSGKWREAFTRTGNAPSGDYKICITVKNTSGEELGSDCIDQRVEIFSSLTLLSPNDEETINEKQLPVFTWLSSPAASEQIYKLKIVEILGNQSPEEAILKNKPFFEKEEIRLSMFQYPLSARKFNPNKKYAWNIQAIGRDGKPIGENNGTSETFSFTVVTPVNAPPTIKLLSPADRESVQTGRSLTFSWQSSSPSGQARGYKFEDIIITSYRLKIVEVIGDQSPENALKGNKPFFEKDSISWPSIEYPSSAPKFIKGKKYAWQVYALHNGEEISASETRNFSADSGGGVQKSLSITSGNQSGQQDDSSSINNPQLPPSSCQASQNPAVVTNQIPSSKSASDFENEYIKVGHFTMKILTASGSSTALTGTGSIVVSWLKTPIAVEFKNIKVNTADELFSGSVISQIDQSPETWPQQWLINGAGSFNWTTSTVKKLDNWLHNTLNSYPVTNKLVKDFDLNQMIQDNTNTPLKLPLGINNAQGYTIAISEMKFDPTEAKLNCVAIFPVDEYNDSVGFKGSDIIFSTGGPSVQSGRLGLIDNVTFTGNIPNGDSYSVVFKKEQSDSDGTFISWDCEGFRELNVDLDVLFPRSWLKPIPDNGTNKAKCNIKTNIVNWDDWIVEANLPNTTISGTQGMELQVTSFYYDHSIVRNPDNIVFPANYPDGVTGVDFTGFFIKAAKIKFPDNFKTSNQNITVNIDNLIINKQGLTGKITAKDIFTFPNGNISGLGASLDTLKLEVICSSITNAYLRGKIVLPVSEINASNSLPFKATFADGNGYQFTIQPQGPINAKFFSDAKLVLANTSSFNLTINDSASFDIKLNGDFEWANINIGPVKNVKMKMGFQNVGLSYNSASTNNNFTFNKGTWSFASPQKSFANFPVSIENVDFGMKPNQGNEVLRGALSFSVVVNLDDKIGGSSALSVVGAIDKNPSTGKFEPKFVEVDIDTIKIFANLSAVKLDGKIAFFNGSPVEGNGFKGTVQATINSIKSAISSTLIMGSTNHQNGNNFFRYWYVDAKIILPKTAAIPFMSGLAFYGFGAGIWKHMTVSAVPPLDLASVQNATQTSSQTNSGATFTPDKNTGLGLKILAVIGTYPEPKAFNSDASLSGEFNQNTGGLNKIEFNFDFWCLTDLTNRSEATILGNANVQYVPPTKVFTLQSSVLINRNPITTVGIGNQNDRVSLSLYINGKNSKWYFICGTPYQTNKVKVLGATAWEYILVGNDIGQFVRTGFQPATVTELNSVGMSYSNPSTTIPSQSSTGKGFSFGVGVNFPNSKSKIIASLPRGNVYLNYGANGGFEVNLSLLQYPEATVCGSTTPIGFRNWYAQGGVAAWFRGFVNVTVPKKSGVCLVCCGSSGVCVYPFIDIKAGLWVQAGFPNPVWVTGQARVSVSILKLIDWSDDVDLSYGVPCTPSPLPDNQTYAQEDATQQIGDMIINIDTPPSSERFDPANKIGATLGFTPNEVFDVQERQTDGSIINKTFQVRYSASLVVLGAAPMNSGLAINSNTQVNQQTSTLNTALNGSNFQTITSFNQISNNQLSTNLNSNNLSANNFASNNPTSLAQQYSSSSVQNLIILLRTPAPNSIGQYGYYIQRNNSNIHLNGSRNLEDTTRYRFTLTAELWTLTGDVWQKAKSKNGSFIFESRVAVFSTGKLEPSTGNQQASNNYQMRLNSNANTNSINNLQQINLHPTNPQRR